MTSNGSDRRDFLRRVGFLIAGATLDPGARASAARRSWSDIYARLVEANDARIDRGPSIEGPGSAARGTANQLQTWAAAYCAPESRHHRSAALARRMEEASRSLLAAQHRDGTIDSGNLQSPPDTAFVVEPLGLALTNLNRYNSPELDRLKANLEAFLRAAGQALTVGGVHTPNHRWVVCAALARLHSLYPSTRFVERIDEWLSEGIDIDADGQFSERSVGIYSAVTNNALVVVARLLGRDVLLEPVRRNLELTVYHMHPDGELETVASRRQDQWRSGQVYADRPFPDNYHLVYRYLALRDGSGLFAEMTRFIEEKAGDRLGSNLGYFLEEPLLRHELPPGRPLPSDYVRLIPGSGLVRIRRGAVSATIYGGSDYPRGLGSGLAGNPTFFTFRKGAAVLESVRMAAHFFRKGFFYSNGVRAESDRYILHQRLEVPYYQPLPPPSRRSDGSYALTPAEDRFWSKMDFPARERSNVKILEQQVTVSEAERGRFQLHVDVSGHEGVPVTLELAFRRGGRLTGVSPSPDAADEYFLERGTGRYQLGDDVIEFGPGRAHHRRTRLEGEIFDVYRGSIRPDALRVYITAVTPFREIITIG